MKRYFLPAAILFLAANVPGQSGPGITGTVKQGSQPIAGAVVTIVSQAKGGARSTAETDAAGEFSISAVPGRYSVTASHSYGDTLVSSQPQWVEVRASGTTRLEISLTLSGPIRETVTIAADQLQPIDEVSKTVTVIAGREMRERADLSLVESLRSIPGFRIQQLGGFGRTASIKTRGLRNQDTAILLDGVRLRDAAAIAGDATPFLADITLTSVSRVEVLRGSGSSIYGTNSIGGTVNFITPEPASRPSGQVSYAAGGLGLQRFRGNFSAATDEETIGFNVAVSRTAYMDGIDGNDDAYNTNFQNRWLFRPSSKTNISARFFLSDASVKLNSNPDTLGALPASNSTIIDARPGTNFLVDQDDPDDSQETSFFNGQASIDHMISSDLIFSAVYSGLKTKRFNDNGPLGAGFQSASTSTFDGLIQTVNAGLQWTPKRHVVKAGYEFEHEKYGNDGSTPAGKETSSYEPTSQAIRFLCRTS
ncbi:MAG: TonB-dependent receptor [Chloracidobacterium sp.]|nr:TonB-dependent receptor [Chloracidobacterium sp.]